MSGRQAAGPRTTTTDRPPPTGPAPVFKAIVGQPRAVSLLDASIAAPVHAYLFTGPAGAGKRHAACPFAAALVCEFGGCGECAACHDALAGRHPDVVVVEREGAAISVGEAHQVALAAQRTPTVSSHQVLVLADFHLVEAAAPALLKTIEEPPSSTVFVVLAESVPPSLVTIASRCVQVEFFPIDAETIAATLITEGVDREAAAGASTAAHGSLDRARLLANDPGFAERQARWRSVPDRLDGTGAAVAELVGQLTTGVEELLGVLKANQTAELTELVAAAERLGDRRVVGRAAIEERHKREIRRVRTDELRAGLATLAEVYRDRLTAPTVPRRRIAPLAAACEQIDRVSSYLSRNVNETLLLESLLLRLGALPS